MRASQAGLALLAGVDAAVLVAVRPQLALVHHLAAPHRWLSTLGADRAALELASAALWVTAAWLGVGLAATAAAVLPGSIGRAGRRLAGAVLPRAVRQLVAGAAGMGVLLSPVLAGATPPFAPPAASASVPTPAWPTDDPLPTPALPTDSPAPPGSGAAPRSSPAHVQAPASNPLTRRAAAVTVQRGDSLWAIAAAHLPGRPADRRIAAAWPRWYAANRDTVGDDPGHLVPGQVLQAPVEENPS